ncbi:ATPase family AAA domain-containing protein 5b isoform X2 [Alosa sapidissima]|uniref:ATPase family AAA domain-containing protein 5b isoform X2 n=1 Tax=Alosa sapidissima TaxID=34773 RepID=UPI001C0A34B9|nr:ATPase family AAA domain-containing protein 5b isoform X2 [Alosa sapidissima]
MASSRKKKTHANPHQTGSITDFFTTARSEATSDVKPHKLKRHRNTGGVGKSVKLHTTVTVNTATSRGSGKMAGQHKPSTVECVDLTCSDADTPVTIEPSLWYEDENPWKCHLQRTLSVDLPSQSSSGDPKDRKCTEISHSKKDSSAKRMPFLSHTLGWMKTSVKSTHKSCTQDLYLPQKELSNEMQTPQGNQKPKKDDKPDTQDNGRESTLQPGGHVLQKPHDNLLWSLPWPTSPLLKNLRGSFPVWPSSVQYPTQWHSVTTRSTPPVDRPRRSGWREDLSEDVLKHLLEEIRVTNPLFPVQRFFTLLSRKRVAHEKTTSNPESVESTRSPGVLSDHCLRGKRKWRLDGLNLGISPKRRRPNHRPEEKAVVEPGSPAGPSLTISGHTPRRQVCRSRLSRTRRRRQQQKASPSLASTVTLNPKETSGKHIENTTPQLHDQECLQEDVLWTEKYQPQHSTEVVGNSAGVKKLHNWLKRWKLRADKEERERKEEMRRKKSKGVWDSGDFEGEVVLADCELELGSALIISGPHGIGKTAAVYACAQELGFKVFEVNASSQRSGRLLLAQLKEATQSHQVGTPTASTLRPTYFSSRGTAACSTKPATSPRKTNSSRKVMTSTRRLPSTLRKSSLKRGPSTSVNLTHFFHKRNKPENTIHRCPKHIQHGDYTLEPDNEKREEEGLPTIIIDQEHNHSITRTGKSALMSLILFEEVDVIFSDDVGFLSAIKTFMSTTKRPVVLTTTDPLFGGTFDCCLEELHFRKPPVVLCSYLQLVCLAENVRTDPWDISSLWAVQRGDIRQCLLQVQFWVRSGGGPTAPLLLNNPVVPRGRPQAQEESIEGSKRTTDLPACDTGCSGTPEVHELARMFKVHTWTTSEEKRSSEILSESQQRGIDLLYLKMEALLPLPSPASHNPGDFMENVPNSGLLGHITAKELPEASVTVDTPRGGRLSSKPRKRRCLSLKGMQRSRPNSPEKTVSPHQSTIRSHHTDQSEGRTEGHSGGKKASCLVSRCLNSLTGFLDNLSFLDCCLQDHGHVMETRYCAPGLLSVRTRAELKDGLLDELKEEQEEEQMWRHRASDFRAAVEGMSFRGCCLEMEPAMAQAQMLGEEVGAAMAQAQRLGEEVGAAMAQAQRLGEEVGAAQCRQMLEQLTFQSSPHRNGLSGQPSQSEKLVAERRADLIKTVLSSKTFSMLGSSPAIYTDYMPCLRTICRSESHQDKDKTKHRFPHYLKSIHTGLSQGTLQLLSADFP